LQQSERSPATTGGVAIDSPRLSHGPPSPGVVCWQVPPEGLEYQGRLFAQSDELPHHINFNKAEPQATASAGRRRSSHRVPVPSRTVELNGMTRVRGFTQDDVTCSSRLSQLRQEMPGQHRTGVVSSVEPWPERITGFDLSKARPGEHRSSRHSRTGQCGSAFGRDRQQAGPEIQCRGLGSCLLWPISISWPRLHRREWLLWTVN